MDIIELSVTRQWGVRDSESAIVATFDTRPQAEWFALTGETLSAANAARSIQQMASLTTEFQNMRQSTRTMFDAQQSIFAAIRLAMLRGQIAIDGQGVVTTSLTDEQIAEIGLDRATFLAGLQSLNVVLSSVGPVDSANIAQFMR